MNKNVIYLKTTNTCNLKCSHCYNSISPFKGTMDSETVNNAIKYLRTRIPDDPLIIFHGGEPTNCDLNIITQIMDALPELRFTITTNLIYKLTKKHLDIFNRLDKVFKNPLVSTSWDYKIRFTKDQENLWESNVKYLMSVGIDVAPIVSVTKYLIDDISPKYLIDKFINLGLRDFNFERITITGRAESNLDLVPKNAEVDKWLLEAYEYSVNLDVKIMLFEVLKESILSSNLVGCRRRSCQKNVVTINPDGTIAGCPNCSNKIYGDILGKFDKLEYESLVSAEELKSNECYLCKYYKYCNGECWQLSWDDTGCPGLKSIMNSIIKGSLDVEF